MRSKWMPLVWLVGGGFVLKQILDKQASQSIPTDQNEISLLDTIQIGAQEILANLSGSKEENFVTVMTPIAEQIKQRYGIDPLITISQAAHESRWGLSGLTQKANNLFGYTGDQWAKEGKSVIWMNTNEYSPKPPEQIQYFSAPGDVISKSAGPNGGTNLVVKRPFKSYPTWYDSVSDWAQLMSATRYKLALEDAKRGDMQAFAQDVWKAGYATDPAYPGKLVAIATVVESTRNA